MKTVLMLLIMISDLCDTGEWLLVFRSRSRSHNGALGEIGWGTGRAPFRSRRGCEKTGKMREWTANLDAHMSAYMKA